MSSEEYFIHIIQNNGRGDGCDYSLDDQLPICGKQAVIATYKATRPKFGAYISGVICQLDITVALLYQQFPDATYVGTAEEERLFEFALQQIKEMRPRLCMGSINRS